MKKSLQNTIIKTSAWTLFFAFVIFSYGIAVFGLAFPRVMGKFSDALGAHSSAAMFCEREYNRKPTTENLYIVLDRHILAGNHRRVVKFGDKFFDMADHDAVIVGVNQHFRERAGTNKLNILRWCNEDNRLKTAITVSLIKTGRAERAAEDLINMLADTDMEQPNHAYFAFVALGVKERPTAEFAIYVDAFATEFEEFTGERVFGLDFLMTAYDSLGNKSEAARYAGLFYDYLR